MELYTIHHTDMMHDRDSQLILRCDDASLIYGLELGIYDFNSGYRYHILSNSISAGDENMRHPSYVFENRANLDLMRWDTSSLGLAADSYPVVLSGNEPMIIPVTAFGASADSLAKVSLQVTYAANYNTSCVVHQNLQGPQLIGVMIPKMGPLESVSYDIERTILRAIDDFNAHLISAGKSWYLEPHVVYDGTDPDASRQAVFQLKQMGITAVLGPVTDDGLEGVRAYDGQMVFVSCCSSDESLAVADHTFRLASSMYDPAKGLASLLIHDNIRHVMIVSGLNSADADSLRLHLADNADVMMIWYDHEIPNAAIREINGMVSDIHGKAAIVVAGGIEMLDLLRVSSEHTPLHDLAWYAIGEIVQVLAIEPNRPEMLVRLVGVQAGPDAGQSGEHLYDILRAELGLSESYQAGLHLYTSYDSVWLLGGAIDASQSLHPDVISSSMPAIAPAYVDSSGILGLDHNGDAIVVEYGIWGMFADDWVRVGTVNVLDDSVRHTMQYP